MKKELFKRFINEIFTKPPHKNFETNMTKIKSIDDTWSPDLLDMDDYAPKNDNSFR